MLRAQILSSIFTMPDLLYDADYQPYYATEMVRGDPAGQHTARSSLPVGGL
jgi:hypothetical protein